MTVVELPPLAVADRLGRVRAAMAELDTPIEALLVTKPENIRWLVGFTGSNGTLLVPGDGAVTLFTDGRYDEQAQIEARRVGAEIDLVITRTTETEIAEHFALDLTCGVESHHLTVDRRTAIGEAAPSVAFVPVGGLIDELRRVKHPAEVARLQRAASIADAALAQHEHELISGGISERGLARSIEDAMFALGADDLSFETIVASGPNSSRPHARPTERVLAPGDLVVIDFGASVDGYGSDMTRTFVVGGEPSDDQQELYDAVQRAQAAGVAAVRAGVEQISVDRACRSSLERDGLADHFVHGTGHGIGLEIHEQPILSQRSVGILPADLVVTVEPGVYLPERGGVRIEDSVVVTNDGCEPITHFPKGLVPWPVSRPTT